MRRSARLLLILTISVSVAGCSLFDSLFAPSKTPLPGERVSILALERTLEPDPRIADLQVQLPKPYVNEDWPQAGGYPSHAMHHIELSGGLQKIWSASVGTGANSELRVTAPPVAGGGFIFAMDAASRISAFDMATGSRIWRVSVAPSGEDSGAFGGGVAYDNGVLYATTGYGEVFALDASSGEFFWQIKIGVPLRGAPAVDGNHLFAISYDNQLHALDIETGAEVWAHTGIPETAQLLGASSPAVEGGLVVAPFSSGEVVALRADTGRPAWTDSLVRTARTSSLASINDINARPVIDRGRVYIIGNAGRMVAFDQRTGDRVWEQDIGGTQQPWVAGDFIFVVTSDAEVLCLSRRDGRIRWVQQLERYEQPEKKKKPISWYGPVLASDRLILVSSHGIAVSLSPYNGELLGATELSDPASQAPIVANDTLFFLTDDADLVALK